MEIPIPNRSVGLSPRGRGNHYYRDEPDGNVRSIPAWAGEPNTYHTRSPTLSVYPRVGGGTTTIVMNPMEMSGLSPRGRGNQGYPHDGPDCGRSIPAWAGEPGTGPARRSELGVYPRVGGGTERQSVVLTFIRGLSPRGRGNRSSAHGRSPGGRSIPAWAGEP